MTATTLIATSRSPGKLILSGEHAVVHGQPALAMAVNRGAQAVLTAADHPGLRLRVPALDSDTFVEAAALPALADAIDRRYDEYQDGRRPVGAILDEPAQLLQYAAAATCREAGHSGPVALEIDIEVDLPVGSGMGSSAALGLAVLAAMRSWLGLPTGPDALEAASMACERLQHGHPSGVDSCVCARGGAIRFTRESRRMVPVPRWPFLLVHTGRPESTTGECVAAVAEQAQPMLWPAFGDTTELLEVALAEEDAAGIRHALRRNHALLCRIGVVPRRVQAFVAAVEAAGGAAKVSGAGSVRGDAAGVLIALDTPASRQLAGEYGYETEEIRGDDHGTTVLPGHGAR